jgi:hypothetical protein
MPCCGIPVWPHDKGDMMSLRGSGVIWLLALWLPGSAAAETAYVSDKIQAGIRAQPVKEGPALKIVSTGTVLEVLERMAGFARVRDAEGTEGWIDAGVLTAELPARSQMEGLKSQLNTLKAQVDKAQASLVQETAKSADLARRLAEKTAQAETLSVQTPSPAPAAATPADGQPSTEHAWFSLGWSVFSFAMLVVGFFAGVAWLREVNRKKLGGMHLRI